MRSNSIVLVATLFSVGTISAVAIPVHPAIHLGAALGGLAWVFWQRGISVPGLLLLGFGCAGPSAPLKFCMPPRGPAAFTIRLHDAPGLSGRAAGTVLHDPTCSGRIRLQFGAAEAVSGGRIVVVGVVGYTRALRVDHFRVLDPRQSIKYRMRDRIRSRVNDLYGSGAPLVQALVLGRREDLDPNLRKRFVEAGAAHLLAISGLHIGILAAWVILAFSRFLRQPAAWGAGAVVVWLYVAFLGFPPSAIRAALFLTVAAVARLRQRNPPRRVVLSITVAALLVSDPAIVSSIGAWLSVAAVWGTTAGLKWAKVLWADRPEGWRKGLVLSLGTSAGATIATAPITAFAFGQVAPVGLLTNLAAMPLAGLAVPGIFLSLVFGSILAEGAALCLSALEVVVDVARLVPFGHLEMTEGVAAGLLWGAVAASGVWIGRNYPTWSVSWRRMSVVGIGVFGMVWVGVPLRAGPEGRLTIHVLSVGQGEAITVRTPRGRWLVIDTGPAGNGFDAGEKVVVPHLERLGAEGVEALFISHGDADHVGGAATTILAMSPRTVVGPGVPVASQLYQGFLRAAEQTGARWWAARTGDSIVIDSVRIVVLHPTADWVRDRVSVNENSIVARLSYGDFDMLLTGDIGFPAESVLIKDGMTAMEVLKVGHHGSKFSTGEDLIERLRPAVAVISVGASNRYGHPAPEVLDRLAERAVKVFRTDLGGTVTIESDGRYFEVIQGRSPNALEKILCAVRTSLRSSSSLSTRNGCTPRQRVTLPTFSTILPWPARSSRVRSDVPV